MALIRWKNRDLYDPWAELKNLQASINELFETDRFPGTAGLFDRNFSPAIDVIENVSNFVVNCELPGLNEKNIDISIAENVLTIKGEKKEERDDKQTRYFKKETWSGNFQRTLTFPAIVDAEKISASFKDGVLIVTLPKKEESKPKQISVNIQGE